MVIEDVFAAGGPLSQVDPRFEHRWQQTEMARAVAEALDTGRHLAVEAGTGVGKSLAYLLPGALWAATSGRRLLVSTYTRALQEQLLEKDLPLVAQVLGRMGHGLRYAMLQGADNYLCAQRLSRLQASPELFASGQARLIEEISRWSATAESGHRSGLPCLVPQSLWGRLSRDPDLCQGPGGRFWGSCLYRRDRERAERAHILVVNHALLLSGARLPSYDALVIDEAHNLEEIASSHFGLTVGPGRFRDLLEQARAFAADFPGLTEVSADLAKESEAFFSELARAHGRTGEEKEFGGRLLADTGALRPPAALLDFEAALLAAAEQSTGAEQQSELRLLQTRSAVLRRDIESILASEGEDLARWVEWSASHVELRAAPLDVAGRLAEGLFSRGVPIVMTSATLSSGSGLKEFKAHVGCPEARELVLDSPFDYPSQAALLLLDELPEPSDDRKYVAALARQCAKIVAQVPGGVFLLFSSWKVLRAVHEKLRRKIKGRPVWIQGAAGSEELLADFSRAGNAVLMGVDTFWQGVDVPGDALSCVVLAKLPFPNFGSPVEEARRKWFDSMGRSYFDAHSLPRAVMKFRQGFGRLIRSSTDRGAVVVLDPRIVRRGYGHAFLESLPRCRRLDTVEELGAFFQNEAAAGSSPRDS